MRFFNSKRFVFLSLVFCFVLRVHHELQFPLLESDYAIQIEAARNFSEGSGFSNSSVHASDLSKVDHVPLKRWPVGYPLLIWLCKFIAGSWIRAQLLLQVLAVVLLIIAFRYILGLFRVGLVTSGLFFIWLGLTPSPFFYLGTSDVITGGFFLLALFLIFKTLAKERWFSVHSMLAAFLLFASATVRFACIPNLVIFPLFLFVLFIFLKEKRYLYLSLFLLSVPFIAIFLFYSLFPIDSSRTGFIGNLIHLNLYFSNLQWFDPFPVKAFYFARPLEFRFPDSKLFILIYRVGMLALSALIVFLLCRHLYRSEKVRSVREYLLKDTPRAHLLSVFIFTGIVIAGFLILQSLAWAPEKDSFGPKWMPPLWTFVYTPRYYLWLMLLLQLMAVLWMDDRLAAFAGRPRGLVLPFSIYGALMAFSVFYFVFINFQFYSPNGNGGGSEWRNQRDEITIIEIVEKQRIDSPGSNIVITSVKRKDYPAPVLLLADASYSTEYKSILNGDFNCSGGNNILYVYTPKDMLEEQHAGIISKWGVPEKTRLADGDLYKFILK